MRTASHFLLIILLACFARAEGPFSFEKTPGKLPKEIVPKRYAVRIEPSVERATLRGSETIEIEVRKAVRKIVLNSLNLEIDKATLHAAQPLALTPKLDQKQQTLTFDLAEELPPGTYTLALEFHGKLTEQPEGLYLTRYQVAGTEKVALTTQFQATDARRMFPCWDEPVFRAIFQLTAVVPEKHAAISNMPVERETKLVDGLKEVVFAPTPSMVSYLLAFNAGEFDALRDEVSGIQLGVYFTEGKREQARYALAATKQLVPYFNEYFGTKYPLPKLDQISFASTAASGMENWGCIIYNDTALLYDPQTSSQSAKERVFAVIAHEIAHQWFGDLVTMAWWDNLWLNEGFASWMGTKATDHFNPEWRTWIRAAGVKENAMRLDARATTHPIQQPIASEAQAGDAFDEITYDKGQAFIRMLESYLGEDKFRDGIRAYMAQHQYSNSTTADLWLALEKVSGRPVREFAAGWTEQPGFPVVKVSANIVEYTLAQERFTLNQPLAEPLTWTVPVMLGLVPEIGAPRLVEMEPDQVVRRRMDLAPLKLNIGDVGYYRVQYEDALFAKLAAAATQLGEADRLNLLNDTWALVQANRVPAKAYLELATTLAGDDSYAVIAQIVNALWFIDELSIGRSEREHFRVWARALLQPQFDKLGWDAKPGENELVSLRRNGVLRTLGGFGDAAVQAEARARFAKFLEKPETLTGDLRDTVWWLVGRSGDPQIYAQLHEAAKRTDSLEQKSKLYGALAAARSPELIARTLALSLTDELPPQQAARLVHRVAEGSDQPELAWEFARQNLDALFAKLSSIRANDYVPGIFDKFSDAARADELEAWSEKNLPPEAAPMTAKAADAIRFKASVKERLLPEIEALVQRATFTMKESALGTSDAAWQRFAMSTLTSELQATIAALDSDSATKLERLVRDAMALAQSSKAKSGEVDAKGWPVGHFERYAGSLANEEWEPPADPPPEPVREN